MSLASPPETIPLDSVNAHSNDSFESSETKIKKIIEAYEDSNKSFAALGVPKKEIFDRIREILSSDLNIELGQFISFFLNNPTEEHAEYLYEADFHSFNMIISAFFGRKCALEMPLTEEHFENIACKTVNHLYYLRNTGPERVRAALQANYKSENTSNENMGFHEDYLNRKFNKSKEILGIAYKAEAMKFLSQKPCFNLMKYRFESRDRVKNKCRGAYIIRKIHQMVDWRPSMQFKLWSHAVFRIIYILIFAYMLCRFPIYDEYDRLDKRNWEDFIPFVYVLSVLLAHLSMICMKLIDFMVVAFPKCFHY
uniref:Ion_trans domain-containing protein n=1 Tax=Caenorhabditis tropicalis TaxID=1561998 RepID=A0A1I7UWU3_9PELO